MVPLTTRSSRHHEFLPKPDESNVTVTYPSSSGTLDTLKNSKTAIYNFVKAELKNHFVVLPPSGAVAGAYATTDKNRVCGKLLQT